MEKLFECRADRSTDLSGDRPEAPVRLSPAGEVESVLEAVGTVQPTHEGVPVFTESKNPVEISYAHAVILAPIKSKSIKSISGEERSSHHRGRTSRIRVDRLA